MKQKFFVPYETAQALKAAGYPQFDIDRSLMYGDDYYYDKDGVIANCGYGLRSIYGDDFKGAENDYILAPTYHEAVDWLESKDIIVIADLDIGFDDVDVNDKWISMFWYDNKKKINPTDSHYKSREEALNAAILKALIKALKMEVVL